MRAFLLLIALHDASRQKINTSDLFAWIYSADYTATGGPFRPEMLAEPGETSVRASLDVFRSRGLKQMVNIKSPVRLNDRMRRCLT